MPGKIIIMSGKIIVDGVAYYSQDMIVEKMVKTSVGVAYGPGRTVSMTETESDYVDVCEDVTKAIDEDCFKQFQEEYVKYRFGKWIGG